MVGLDELFPMLRRKNSVKVNHKIFCHAITKAFLVNKFKKDIKDIERFIFELRVNETKTIRVFDRQVLFSLLTIYTDRVNIMNPKY